MARFSAECCWGMAGVTLLGLAAYVGRGYFLGSPEEDRNDIEMIEIPEGSFRMGSETGSTLNTRDRSTTYTSLVRSGLGSTRSRTHNTSAT